MPFHGSIVVIKRSGFDGSVFPLVNGDCLMGRAETCDIRVQLPTVSDEHCRIEVNENDEVSSWFPAWNNKNLHIIPQTPIPC